MPKMKTHSGAKKRFRLTAKGKVKYKKAGARHLLAPTSGNEAHEMRKPAYLNEVQGKIMRRFLPNG